MARATVQEALDYCLANPDGLSVEELLNRFPEYRDELQPLLAISADLAGITPPPVPADRRASMRQRLMAAASAQQVTQPVPVTLARSQPAKSGQSPTPRFVVWLRRPAFAIAVVIILLLGSAWSASANSLPDSPFYGVKLNSENLLLNFASSAADKVREHIDLANVRLSDLQTMQNRNRLAEAGPAFTNYNYHLSNGISIWNSTTGDTRTELARILYTSSVAGQYTFSALRSSLANSSTELQANYDQATKALNDLNTSTTQVLKTARIDPATLLQSGAPEVADVAGRAHIDAQSLLTPVPAISPFALNQSGTTTTIVGENVTSTVQATPEQTSSVPAAVATSPAAASTALPGTPTAPATSSAGPTSTLPRVNATAMPIPTIGKPTPQASPSRRATPPRPSATNTRPAAPSATARPPSPTPTLHLVPTNTSLPTSTSNPAATPAPPLITATVTSANSCGLSVQSVLTFCNAQSCSNWTALVENTGPDRIKATWIAELQIKVGSGSFQAVASDQKIGNVAPGANNLSGSFCFSFPSDTTSVRVKLTVTADDNSCSVAATSTATAPCVTATATPVPRPTHEPTRQPTPPPNVTDEPRPTREPRATPELRKTQGPEETRKPDEEPDPSPPPPETRQPRPTREPEPFSVPVGL